VVASLFRILLTTEGGLVNVLLHQVFGIGPINWLDSTEWSKVSVAVMNIWRMTGYLSLVLLAGMQKISTSVIEAAELDGANAVKKFFHITLPLLSSEIFFVLLMSTIWIFQNIGDVMVLTGGGPLNSSTNLVLYIYRNAYEFSKVGYASAMSYVLFVILLLFSAFSVKGHYRGKEQA
jgi:ABC-type sugar transport systems, permease components